MKALVLAGGLPQVELIEKLKKKSIYTILADYLEHPIAKDYADKFYRVSTLDENAIKHIAIQEHVDFLITVCTDQALLTVAKVSEELGLPCYIDYQTARNVTNKSYMKKVFAESSIPTAKFRIVEKQDDVVDNWNYPLIVKPVDCNSSKGVTRVINEYELINAYNSAVKLSRTKTAIIEEYIEGKELSVDVYVENGKAIVLDITTSEKIKDNEKFIIFRTWHPARITEGVKTKVSVIAQQIADAFHLKNTPMLVQMLTKAGNVYVIEFSARTGGGVKYISIKRRTGFDVIDAVIDLTLGKNPSVEKKVPQKEYLVDEYIYCKPGVFDHLEGFDSLKANGTITDYYQFKYKGAQFEEINNSGDRIGGFSIEGDSFEVLKTKHEICNREIKAISDHNEDLIRHDLLSYFKEIES